MEFATCCPGSCWAILLAVIAWLRNGGGRMSETKTMAWTEADYDRAAEDYVRRLPLEHYMEALPQSTQRRITVESLDLLHSRRPEVQVFNEPLIQYFRKGRL